MQLYEKTRNEKQKDAHKNSLFKNWLQLNFRVFAVSFNGKLLTIAKTSRIMVLEKKAKQTAINKQVAHTQRPPTLSATDFVLRSGGCLD